MLTSASLHAASLPVAYDTGTRNVAPTDLDYVGASGNFTTLQVNSVAVVSEARTLTIAGTPNEITSSAGAQSLAANRTWTFSLPAALTFTGKTVTGGTFSSPTIGTPTFTGAATWPDNVRQTFNPGADAAGLNAGSHAGNPGTLSNGDLWYNSSSGALMARINGASVALGAGGGSGTVGTMINVGASVQYNFTYYTDDTGTNMAPALVGTDATLTNLYAGGFFINTLTVTNPIPVTSGGTGLAAGTSGGVLYFSGSTTIASSAALTANAVVVGGGAGAAPSASAVSISAGVVTGATYDAAGTGNTLKQTKQLILQRPDYGDGAGAVPQTNTFTASGLMHYTFSGNAETNANWAVYEFDCPSDLDTAVAMTARFGFLSGGTDADDYVFHLTYDQVAAGTAYPTGTGVDLLPIVMTVTPVTPAAGDLQYSSAVTLTGWAAALTPGRAMQVRIARLQNSQDDGARDVQLVITYGSTL